MFTENKKIKFLFVFFFVFILLGITYPQMRYYKGNTHCHTLNSDGWATPDSVAKYYKFLGFDFLIITDHNFLTNGEGLNIPGFLLINGEEITMTGTHFNGYRLSRLVNPSGYSPQRAIDSVNAQNAICILNHPRWVDSWYTYDMVMALKNISHFEIYNLNSEVMGLWDSLLTGGNRKFLTMAADDSHSASACGTRWIMVKTGALQRDSILNSIKNGNFYSTSGILIDSINYNSTSIYIKFGTNCTSLKFIGKDGTVYKTVNSNIGSYTFNGSEKYIRIYASGNGSLRAWTQPVYINTLGIGSNQLTVKYSLCQNIPNPFNSKTKISFYIQKDGNVTLKIFNILGKEISEPLNKFLKSGKHSFIYDVTELPSGIYYYKLISLNGSEIKKMIIIK